jgi:hypothetical protein
MGRPHRHSSTGALGNILGSADQIPETPEQRDFSMSTLFELSVCAFFEVGLVCVGPAPDAGEHAVVLAAVKDASRR